MSVDLSKVRLVLGHGGPGPHESGSSQDVHGSPGSGSASTTSTPAGAGPAGGYEVRESNQRDKASLIEGMDTNRVMEWSEDQRLSVGLFHPGHSKVLTDSSGNVQAHYRAGLIDQDAVLAADDIDPGDLYDFTDGGEKPYGLLSLGVAPRNLEPGGERGWGLAAVREVIRDARAAGADYIILTSSDSARGFYAHVGMAYMGAKGYTGLYAMSKYRWDKFEEAYDARFKK